MDRQAQTGKCKKGLWFIPTDPKAVWKCLCLKECIFPLHYCNCTNILSHPLPVAKSGRPLPPWVYWNMARNNETSWSHEQVWMMTEQMDKILVLLELPKSLQAHLPHSWLSHCVLEQPDQSHLPLTPPLLVDNPKHIIYNTQSLVTTNSGQRIMLIQYANCFKTKLLIVYIVCLEIYVMIKYMCDV